jgi:hypothetical protein
VEALNYKARITLRKCYGFRTFRVLELAPYYSIGKLLESEPTHDSFFGPRRRNSWVGLLGRASGGFAKPLKKHTFRERCSPRPESISRNQFALGFRQPLGPSVKSGVWDLSPSVSPGFPRWKAHCTRIVGGPDRWTDGTIFPPPHGHRRKDSLPSCQLCPQNSPKTHNFSSCDTTTRSDGSGRQVSNRFGEFTDARDPRILQVALVLQF